MMVAIIHVVPNSESLEGIHINFLALSAMSVIISTSRNSAAARFL
jgi:hypothetical protein